MGLKRILGFCAALALVVVPAAGLAAQAHTSTVFAGAKVNGGTVTYSQAGNTRTLTLSDDFKVPDTPDPHWQVVDSKGRIYLLQKLTIKGDKFNKSITLPSYVPDVVKVQIYCSWAEALLGEASFAGKLTN